MSTRLRSRETDTPFWLQPAGTVRIGARSVVVPVSVSIGDTWELAEQLTAQYDRYDAAQLRTALRQVKRRMAIMSRRAQWLGNLRMHHRKHEAIAHRLYEMWVRSGDRCAVMDALAEILESWIQVCEEEEYETAYA